MAAANMINVTIAATVANYDNTTFPTLSPGTEALKTAMEWIDAYLMPVVLAVGVIGNSLSFAVFVGSHLRRHSPNVYLASLAVADNAFLVCVLMSYENGPGVSLYYRPGWCQTLVYLTYVSSFLSVWYVVAFTMERYILVCCPLRRRALCRTRVAGVVTMSLAVFAFLAYSFAPAMSGVVQYGEYSLCVPLPQYFGVVSTLNNLDTLVTLIVPTVIIIGCNIRITLLVGHFYKNHQAAALHCRKWDFRRPPPRHNVPSRAPPTFVPGRAHMRVTRMLLTVSTVFLVCNLPSHAARTYAVACTLIDSAYRPSVQFMLCQQFFQMLYYTNFSVNFFLYSISGRSFRLGLRRMGTKLGDKARRVVWLWVWSRGRSSPSSSPQLLSTRTENKPKAKPNIHSHSK